MAPSARAMALAATGQCCCCCFGRSRVSAACEARPSRHRREHDPRRRADGDGCRRLARCQARELLPAGSAGASPRIGHRAASDRSRARKMTARCRMPAVYSARRTLYASRAGRGRPCRHRRSRRADSCRPDLWEADPGEPRCEAEAAGPRATATDSFGAAGMTAEVRLRCSAAAAVGQSAGRAGDVREPSAGPVASEAGAVHRMADLGWERVRVRGRSSSGQALTSRPGEAAGRPWGPRANDHSHRAAGHRSQAGLDGTRTARPAAHRNPIAARQDDPSLRKHRCGRRCRCGHRALEALAAGVKEEAAEVAAAKKKEVVVAAVAVLMWAAAGEEEQQAATVRGGASPSRQPPAA